MHRHCIFFYLVVALDSLCFIVLHLELPFPKCFEIDLHIPLQLDIDFKVLNCGCGFVAISSIVG